MTSRLIVLDPTDAANVRLMATEACYELFATLATPVVAVPNPSPEEAAHDVAAFIGFTGPVRGSLMISSVSELFQASYPPGGSPPSVAELFDWAGEITNQLLGRIKRRFCERGIDFQVSTPTAVRGRGLGGRNPVREGVCDLAFTVGKELVAISLEIFPESPGRLFNEPAQPIGCTREGELVLF